MKRDRPVMEHRTASHPTSSQHRTEGSMQPTQNAPEQWRAVVGHEGRYEISDQGRLRSIRRTSQLLIKGTQTHWGHTSVKLYRHGKCTRTFLHAVVLEAFVGPRPHGMESCHNNGNPADNRLANLRWDTKSANIKDVVKHGNHNYARRTHCLHGHAYDDQNTMICPSDPNHRRCRACLKAARKIKAARKAS